MLKTPVYAVPGGGVYFPATGVRAGAKYRDGRLAACFVTLRGRGQHREKRSKQRLDRDETTFQTALAYLRTNYLRLVWEVEKHTKSVTKKSRVSAMHVIKYCMSLSRLRPRQPTLLHPKDSQDRVLPYAR